MKKILTSFIFSMLLLNFIPAMAANSNEQTTQTSTLTLKSEATQIEQRVKEIRNMDKRNLTQAEKKSLRKELIGFKNKAKDPVGIYISGSALLIIIILLIILL